jgi:hypothetical protein
LDSAKKRVIRILPIQTTQDLSDGCRSCILFYLKNVNAKMENLIVNDNFYAQELSVEEMESLTGGTPGLNIGILCSGLSHSIRDSLAAGNLEAFTWSSGLYVAFNCSLLQ